MLQYLNNSVRLKAITITVVVISLAACSPSGENATNSSSSASSPSLESPNNSASPASSPSNQQTDSPSKVSIPGVNDVKEINFKANSPQNPPNGAFDAINGSNALTHEVSRQTPIRANGWAVLVNENKPADLVIITYGDNKSLVAVAPVNSDRSDVSKFLRKPSYKNSGWSTTVNPSNLPTGQVVLKAWAYNSTAKEANELNNTHQLVISN